MCCKNAPDPLQLWPPKLWRHGTPDPRVIMSDIKTDQSAGPGGGAVPEPLAVIGGEDPEREEAGSTSQDQDSAGPGIDYITHYTYDTLEFPQGDE